MDAPSPVFLFLFFSNNEKRGIESTSDATYRERSCERPMTPPRYSSSFTRRASLVDGKDGGGEW